MWPIDALGQRRQEVAMFISRFGARLGCRSYSYRSAHAMPGPKPAHRTMLLAAVAAVALSLTACGGSKGTSANQGSGSGTVTFVNAQDPGTFDQLIAAFEKANPNITIKQQVVPGADLNTTLQSRLGGKDPGIDVYEVDEPRLASLASRGYLVPLDDLSKQAQGKVDPKALAATTFNGKQYSMPRWTSSQLLYYNKAVLRRAGISAPSSDPKSPSTWEQLATEAKTAQTAGAAKWGFTFEQVDLYYQLQPLPESAGGGSGLTGNKMLTPDITNAGWVKAMNWYAATFKAGISPRGVNAEQTEPLFAGGNTAFFAGGPWNAPLFDKVKALDYGVAPYPKFAGGKDASSTGSWSVGISPFSKNQAAAKKFIAYMTIDPNGAWLASSRNIPVQLDAATRYMDQLRAQGSTSKQVADIVQNELANNAVARPTSVGYVDFESVMNKAFADIRNGSDPSARLQQATGELNRVFDKYK
jgi:multiple sugar transport system substrate-binding protein